jgi:hypothetical protein
VTFKKIKPQPEKTKRQNNHVALRPHSHNSTLCLSPKMAIKLKNKNKAAEHGFTKITIHDTGLLSSPKFQDAFLRSLQQIF